MKKKFEFSAFFAKNWWYYLIWLLLTVVAWELVFSTLTKPKEEQSVYIFCGVENTETDELNKQLESVKPDYVKNIDVTSYSARGTAFDMLMSTRGQTEADIFILPDGYANTDTMKALFFPMEISVVKNLFGADVDLGVAVDGDKAYGIKIYDATTGAGRAESFFTYTYKDDDGERKALGDYYIFFAKKSKHLGAINDSKFDGALVFAMTIWAKE